MEIYGRSQLPTGPQRGKGPALRVYSLAASPSHDFCQKVLRHKTWTDKQSGYEFDFGCVLVDPPRAGLDARTRALVSRYDHILYVSCSPYVSLRRDVDELAKNGLLLRQMCLLDHFPYTHHAECAVYLSRA